MSVERSSKCLVFLVILALGSPAVKLTAGAAGEFDKSSTASMEEGLTAIPTGAGGTVSGSKIPVTCYFPKNIE